jgi:hypothetical protein
VGGRCRWEVGGEVGPTHFWLCLLGGTSASGSATLLTSSRCIRLRGERVSPGCITPNDEKSCSPG